MKKKIKLIIIGIIILILILIHDDAFLINGDIYYHFSRIEYIGSGLYLYMPNFDEEEKTIKDFIKKEYPNRKLRKIKPTEVSSRNSCFGTGSNSSYYTAKDKKCREYEFKFTEGKLAYYSYKDKYFEYCDFDNQDFIKLFFLEEDFKTLSDNDYIEMSEEVTSALKEKIDNKIPVRMVISYELCETEDLEIEIFYDKNKSYEENVQINSETIKKFLQDIANKTSKFDGKYFNCFSDVDLNNKTITKIELLDNYNFDFLEELSKNKTMKMSFELTNLLKEKADNNCLDTYLYLYYQPSKTETKIKIFYDNDKTYCENLINNKKIIDDFLQRIITIIYFNGCSA